MDNCKLIIDIQSNLIENYLNYYIESDIMYLIGVDYSTDYLLYEFNGVKYCRDISIRKLKQYEL